MPTFHNSTRSFLSVIALVGAVACGACQNPPVGQVATNANSNTNTNVANTNVANTNVAAAAVTPMVNEAGVPIEAREPEKYTATLAIAAETMGGERAMAIPQLTAQVSRNGADRRIAFNLPNNEQLIFLDKLNARYIISPNRKQYAELTPEATGFEVPRMMTPGQIVGELQKTRGYQLVGEEIIGNRPALKYTYAGTSKTGTEAGDVKAEAFVYVDKETGLPLRSELASEAQGSVQGIKGLKIITEMRDLKVEVDPATFEIPEGYSKVAPEQVRQQISALMAIAQALLQNVTAQGNQAAPVPTSTITTPAQ
ncbi:MAG: hypothetical protein WKF30_04070 [Pyrinomonadaceae bacterium]